MLKRVAVTTVLLLGVALSLSTHCLSQQDGSQTKRKVVNKVSPEYPALARTMSLRGTVKVAALVSPNGNAKTVEIKGGHPVLAQAAMYAVRKWKWEQSPHESTEIIEVTFDPQ
jgi:TonB family protein